MPQAQLTPEQQEEATLASFWRQKFMEAMVAKAPYTKRWQMYWDAYYGDYFKNENRPDYKSNEVSNYIFSIIETIRPIMLDNDPKFQAIARQPEGMALSNDLQEALSYEWDRERVRTKLFRELITTLVTGTTIYFIPWNREKKNVEAIPVNPFNFFVDPLATSIFDAEHAIYASYYNAEVLRRAFPKKRERLTGSQVNYGELVHNNNRNAMVDNQILVLEVYTKDLETRLDDGKPKYPNGRVLTVCPEIGLLLEDKAMPYNDGTFPFRVLKDYDVPGKFWGEGEVAQLISPQTYMNELNNAIIDNAKATANMPWIIDKNSGIGQGKITNRPGLIIRKNPGTEVRREQPPTMPSYVQQTVADMKADMEQVSGIFDTLKGNSETGVYTAQGILALQEAGQARIRLKVKILEEFLGEMATLWVSRMRQFWKEDRYIRITRADGTYNVKEFNGKAFSYDYDVRITAGSTMQVNRGAMLDLMIRLAQTQMPDGQMLVDREAVVQYLPEEAKASLLRRMQGKEEALTQQVEQISQQLEQFVQQDQADDEQTMSTLEQLASTMEQLNRKILQLEEERVKVEEEKKKREEVDKLKETSYNEGYRDAENDFTSQESPMEGESLVEDVGEEPLNEEMPLPDDLLDGLEELSDDELALLLESNPEIADLIR